MAVLVVSATEVEANRVPARFEVLICGLGKTAAAAAVASALANRGTVPEIVAIGTAGALRQPHHGGIYLPSRVINHDISAAAIRALGYPLRDELDLPDGDGSVLATGDTFVSDPAIRSHIAQRADLVDMEGFAIAWAAHQAGARCRIVKHVTDTADETALNWAEAVDISAGVLADWLAATYR